MRRRLDDARSQGMDDATRDRLEREIVAAVGPIAARYGVNVAVEVSVRAGRQRDDEAPLIKFAR